MPTLDAVKHTSASLILGIAKRSPTISACMPTDLASFIIPGEKGTGARARPSFTTGRSTYDLITLDEVERIVI